MVLRESMVSINKEGGGEEGGEGVGEERDSILKVNSFLDREKRGA